MKRQRTKLFLFFSFLLIVGAAFLILFNAKDALAFELEIQYPRVPGAESPQVFLEKIADKVPGYGPEKALPLYLKYFYILALTFSGAIAFVAIFWGGLKYLFSVGSAAKMADAKDQISKGVLGIIILLGSYLILTTINPQLAVFHLSREAVPVRKYCWQCDNGSCIPKLKTGSDPCPTPCALNNDCRKCVSGKCTWPSDLTCQTNEECQTAFAASTYVELPVENSVLAVLDETNGGRRLEDIATLSGTLKDYAKNLRDKSQELKNLLAQCSCSNTNSNCICDPDNNCIATDPDCGCQRDPCRLNRTQIDAKKQEIQNLLNSTYYPQAKSALTSKKLELFNEYLKLKRIDLLMKGCNSQRGVPQPKSYIEMAAMKEKESGLRVLTEKLPEWQNISTANMFSTFYCPKTDEWAELVDFIQGLDPVSLPPPSGPYTPPSPPPQPTGVLPVELYCQNDPNWGNIRLGRDGDYMYNSGCNLTSFAMIMRYYGFKKTPANVDYNPAHVADFVNQNGLWIPGLGTNNLALFGLFKESENPPLRYRFRTISSADVPTELVNGHPVFTGCYNFDNHGWQHWIVIKGIVKESGVTYFYIADPYCAWQSQNGGPYYKLSAQQFSDFQCGNCTRCYVTFETE